MSSLIYWGFHLALLAMCGGLWLLAWIIIAAPTSPPVPHWKMKDPRFERGPVEREATTEKRRIG